MKLIAMLVLCISVMVIPALAVDESKPQAAQLTFPNSSANTVEWVNVVTGNTVVATSAVLKINAQTPENEMNALLKTALTQVQKMRESIKPYGIIVESFSVNIGLTPSITVNFRFKE